jgi:hypothetical protein
MTIYTDQNGEEILVCDRCGVTPEGTRPDVSKLKPIDPTDGLHQYLRAHGVPESDAKKSALGIQDFCPDCGPKQKGATPLP